MEKNKQLAIDAINENESKFTSISDKVWEFAELSLKEYKSAELYCAQFEKDGWKVEKGLDGIETCFKAEFGAGHPVIGILGEFDALSGLSQVGGCPEYKELVKGGSGHGCGHNMLGAGSMAAAYGVRAYLEKTGKPGTVIYFGCPGEEGGASKAFLARDGYWKKLDAAISWHPGTSTAVRSGTSNSCIQKEYIFKGVAAHAAGSPQFGRSGLDAVQIMNMGVEFLREHMDSTSRIHYAITDAGGISPNVVPPIAKVLYMVRAIQVQDCIALQKRVDKIAEAAAMMTETELSVRFIDGLANLVPNNVLEKQMQKSLELVGMPKYTPEEYALAEAIDASTGGKGKLPPEIDDEDPDYDYVAEMTDNGNKGLNDFIMPLRHSNAPSPGSTDVGDVSWLTPTVQMRASCFTAHAPGHSWQNVSMGKTSIGHKGLILGGKVMALTAIDLYEDPSIIEAATEEFKKRTKAGFLSPIPMDAVPTIV